MFKGIDRCVACDARWARSISEGRDGVDPINTGYNGP